MSPCEPTAVDTLTPDGSVTVPFDASWFCVDVDTGLAEVEATLDKRFKSGAAAPQAAPEKASPLPITHRTPSIRPPYFRQVSI